MVRRQTRTPLGFRRKYTALLYPAKLSEVFPVGTQLIASLPIPAMGRAVGVVWSDRGTPKANDWAPSDKPGLYQKKPYVDTTVTTKLRNKAKKIPLRNVQIIGRNTVMFVNIQEILKIVLNISEHLRKNITLARHHIVSFKAM